MENRTKITSKRNTLILIADTTQCFSKQAFRSCFVETYTPTHNVSYCFIKKCTIPYTQFTQFIYPFVLRCNISLNHLYSLHKYLMTRQSIISCKPFVSRQLHAVRDVQLYRSMYSRPLRYHNYLALISL